MPLKIEQCARFCHSRIACCLGDTAVSAVNVIGLVWMANSYLSFGSCGARVVGSVKAVDSETTRCEEI